MSAVAEALEALGHPTGALPAPRLLADLFVRFQAQVPLRSSPQDAGAEETLSAWLGEGAGCCGEARVGAFEALASAAGFASEPASARDGDGVRRRVILAAGGRLLLDPAFPLPAPLSLDPPASEEPTGYGNLSVRGEGAGPALFLDTRGEERLLFRVEPGRPPAPAGQAGPAPGGLFRLLDDRLLRWNGGVLEVSDAWSRFRLPFPASDADGLGALFGPPIALPGEAPAPPAPSPTLAVYHATVADAERLRSLLSNPAAHAALLPEGWGVDGLARGEAGFERTLVEDGALLRRERFTHLPDGFAVEAEGPLALFRTRTLRIEPRRAGARLRLLATLRDPVPPRGLPEGTRRRLVFELASELLALDRLATDG